MTLFQIITIASFSLLYQGVDTEELFRLRIRDESLSIYVSLERPVSISTLEDLVCEILEKEQLDESSFKMVRIFFFVDLQKYVPSPLPTASEAETGEKSLGVYFWNRSLLTDPSVHELKLYADTELRRYDATKRPSRKFDFASQCSH